MTESDIGSADAGRERARRSAGVVGVAGRLASEQLAIGIEEEFMLLDPRDWSLAFRSDEVIADLRAGAARSRDAGDPRGRDGGHHRGASPGGRCGGGAGRLRWKLARALAGHGLRAGVAGMHPSAVGSETVVSSHPRYRDIGASMRVLARREPTLATHIHVGIADPRAAVRLLNRLRVHLPLLLALSANSPFWQGRATGFASTRTTVFDAFPRSGVPRAFRGYADWVETVDALLRSGAIADPSLLWWDARLQPRSAPSRSASWMPRRRSPTWAPSRRSSSRSRGSSSSVPTVRGRAAGRRSDRGEPLPGGARRDAGAADRRRLGRAHRRRRSARRVLAACRPTRSGSAASASSPRCAASVRASGASRQLAQARDGDLRPVTAGLARAYAADLPTEVAHTSSRPGGRPSTFAVREGPYERESLPSVNRPRDHHMAESVYRVTEVIGISSESWEAAARNAVATAAKTVRDLRVAEVIRQDLTIEEGGVVNFRVRLGMSFKYDSGD